MQELSTDSGIRGDLRKMETDHYLLAGRVAETPAAIRQVMPFISEKILAQQLHELGNDGIVQRKPTGAIPAPSSIR
jgi:HxlR-like helix-turn-helix